MRRAKKIISSIIISSFVVSLVSGYPRVNADWVKSQENTRLGVSGIADPVVPTSPDSPWRGSYVYYGKVNGDPIKFRVLDANTNRFGETTMFLDSDCVLQNLIYDSDPRNDWSHSSNRSYLNGEGFLYKDGVFSQEERTSIAQSFESAGNNYQDSFLADSFDMSIGLDGDKIFLLDAMDIVNPRYGYSSDPGRFWSD